VFWHEGVTGHSRATVWAVWKIAGWATDASYQSGQREIRRFSVPLSQLFGCSRRGRHNPKSPPIPFQKGRIVCFSGLQTVISQAEPKQPIQLLAKFFSEFEAGRIARLLSARTD